MPIPSLPPLPPDFHPFDKATSSDIQVPTTPPPTSYLKDSLSRLFRNKIALASLLFLGALTLACLLLPALWPYSYDQQLGLSPTAIGKVDPSYNNLPPLGYGESELTRIEAGEFVFPHLLGTDSLGRDFFIRVVYGTGISLAVGGVASLIVLVVGTLMGGLAGYFGGRVDLLIMGVVDVIYALPDMLMVILLSALLGEGLENFIQNTPLAPLGSHLFSLFLVFALLYWVSMARMVRGQMLSLRRRSYVTASKASGGRGLWILRRHLLRGCVGVMVISTAMQIPSAIFTESYLSYLGLGVSAPTPSLGSLAADGLSSMGTYPYRLVVPAVVLSLMVLALHLLGDGVREAFER